MYSRKIILTDNPQSQCERRVDRFKIKKCKKINDFLFEIETDEIISNKHFFSFDELSFHLWTIFDCNDYEGLFEFIINNCYYVLTIYFGETDDYTYSTLRILETIE